MNITALVSTLQALTSDVEKKKMIFGALLSIQDIRKNFTFVPNMKKGMLQPIFSISPSARPFTTTFTGTDTQNVAAKKLELYKGKIEQKVTPSTYEDWFETLGLLNGFDWRDTEALAKFIIDTIIEVEAHNIRTNVLYNGVVNPSGTSPLDSMTGFGKLIADGIVSGIPTNQIEPTGTMTQANTYDNVRKIVDRVGEPYLAQRDMQVLSSRQIVSWWIDGYKANHNGSEPTYIYEPVLADGVDKEGAESLNGIGNKRIVGVYLDGIHSGIPMKIEESMKAKQRVIAGPKSNFQVGTNMADFAQFLFDILRQHYTFDVFARYDMACGIYELGNGSFATNDVA